jgi:hypothetical protein
MNSASAYFLESSLASFVPWQLVKQSSNFKCLNNYRTSFGLPAAGFAGLS